MTVIKRAFVLSISTILLCVMSGSNMAQNLHQRAINYVQGLQTHCTLSDGYQCAEIEEDSFLTPESWGKMVPAVYLPAWDVAYSDFKGIDELTDEQKNLRHYRIGFTEDDSHYIILIDGLLLPLLDDNGNQVGLAQAVFGRSAKYWIDQKTLEITKRLFMK